MAEGLFSEGYQASHAFYAEIGNLFIIVISVSAKITDDVLFARE